MWTMMISLSNDIYWQQLVTFTPPPPPPPPAPGINILIIEIFYVLTIFMATKA
jgi:hypothetical protein